MSGKEDDAGDKSFEATPQKLQKAREKGEIARSADLSVAAAYLGLFLALTAFGPSAIQSLGNGLLDLVDHPDLLAQAAIDGHPDGALRGALWHSAKSASPIFIVPALAVLISVVGQRALVFTPSKLAPRLSRISLISNAGQKFGRNGLFEFAKSFAKLLIYALCLALFLSGNLDVLISATGEDPAGSTVLMAQMALRFLAIACMVAVAIGLIDVIWQHAEHRRKNRMSRREIMDEAKDAEGDPYLKQRRREAGQEIARNQMLADVPGADVVIVNPTHFAVALKWSRQPGSAPVCVARGQDEIARAIRDAAASAGVPIHHDPPTARALFATVSIGEEIARDQFAAVAAAIRFADDMRRRARGRLQ